MFPRAVSLAGSFLAVTLSILAGHVAQAGVTKVVGGSKTTVVQYDGSTVVQNDLNQESVPGSQAEPPAVSRAKLDRLSPTGDVTASAQGVTVFDRAGPGQGGPANDLGMDLAAFSDDPKTHWFVEGAGQEVRTVVINPAETNGQALLSGISFRARSRLTITGAMVISTKDGARDLTGTRVQFGFSILLRLQDGTTSTPLEGEVVLVGGPEGSARVESAGGALSGAFLPLIDFGDQVTEMAHVHTLIFPAVALPYDYTIIVGQPYELELQAQAQITTVSDGVAAGAVFGLPQQVLQQVFSRTKLDDAGQQIAALIRGQVDTSGASAAPYPILDVEPSPFVCGAIGFESLGLLLTGATLAISAGGRRRGRRGERSACRI